MAGKKRNNRRKSKTNNRRRRRSGSAKQRSSVTSQGIGSVVAKGVRNLIASIPGVNAFTPIADIALKAFGYANLIHSDGVFTGSVDIGALTSRFCLTYVNVLAGSPNFTRSFSVGEVTHSMKVYSPYQEARLLELTVIVAPTNPQAHRAGTWYLGFRPFYDQVDHEAEMTGTAPGRLGMGAYPISTSGPMSRSLSVSYRPRVADGYVYHFHPVSSMFGCVAFRYEDFSRDKANNFTAAQFACEFRVMGRVELRGQFSTDSNVMLFEDKFKQSDLHMSVEDYGTGEVHTLFPGLSRVEVKDTITRVTFVESPDEAFKLLSIDMDDNSLS